MTCTHTSSNFFLASIWEVLLIIKINIETFCIVENRYVFLTICKWMNVTIIKIINITLCCALIYTFYKALCRLRCIIMYYQIINHTFGLHEEIVYIMNLLLKTKKPVCSLPIMLVPSRMFFLWNQYSHIGIDCLHVFL